MTAFTIIGLIIVALIGLAIMIWAVGVTFFFSAFGGKSKWWEHLIILAIFCVGATLECWVFTHIHISLSIK